MFDFDSPISDYDDDSSEPVVSRTEQIQTTIALLSTAHAMADFVRSDDKTFTAFCKFLKTENDEDAAGLRESMQMAHDAYISLIAQAQARLAIEAILGFFGGDSSSDDGDDGDDDEGLGFSVISI